MRALCAGLAAILLSAGPAPAQELEPRAYSPAPTGTTFLAVSATRSSGGVFTDPAAALKNVDARIGIFGVAVGRMFALMGKSVQIFGVLPVARGRARGDVGDDRHEVTRSGLADPRIRVSMILAGSPAATRAEFARAPRRPIVGTSVTIVPPLGQYDSSKLVNLGSNRWSLKPELGLSLPAGPWTIDAYAAVWYFTDNDAYYPGSSHRHQDPVVALQSHVSYTFKPRTWLAVNGTWYGGGQFTVEGAVTGEPYHNTRLGATLALPFGRRQSLKVAYSAGATTRVGADFRTISAAWQIVLY